MHFGVYWAWRLTVRTYPPFYGFDVELHISGTKLEHEKVKHIDRTVKTKLEGTSV